jgi:predicted aldo/keto reductase-like oxidoreductase
MMPPEHRASNCEECGECEEECPQQIEIMEALKKVDDLLRQEDVPEH